MLNQEASNSNNLERIASTTRSIVTPRRLLLGTAALLVSPAFMAMANILDYTYLSMKHASSDNKNFVETYQLALDSISETFGIDFEIEPEISSNAMSTFVGGRYGGSTDTILSNKNVSYLPPDSREAIFSFLKVVPSTKDILVHELGHAWLQRISWELESALYTEPEDSIKRIINEGTGMYFEFNAGDIREPGCNEWPVTIYGYSYSPINSPISREYNCGFVIVKPILDELGVTEGITQLLINPPTEEDLVNDIDGVKKYQERILNFGPLPECAQYETLDPQSCDPYSY